MSGTSGNGVIPSGFFAPQQQQQPSNNNRNSHHLQNQQQSSRQFGYVHNYGQPISPCYPYNNNYPLQQPTTTLMTTAAGASLSRKRPRELQPSSTLFRCEPCGLDLDSDVALASHQKSHVKCSACAFEGAPKVVKGHYQSIHGKFAGQGFKTVTVAIPGCPVQRFRICVGNRPDDVQAWIADRKKKFPRSRPAATPGAASSVADSANKPAADTKGLATLLEGYSSSDDEKEDPGVKPEADAVTTQPEAVPESVTPSPPPAAVLKKPCHSFVRHGRCRRGTACPYSHDESLRRPKHEGKHNYKRKKDLLSLLLESDADRESKLSLQLVHYLVHSDFLKKRA